jgi:hypothetical protein
MNPLCVYCQKHRWCLTCKTGHDGESCPACGAALEPAPVAQPRLGGELYHESCAKVAEVLGMHQLLLSQVAGHGVSAYEAALQRVVKLKHTGWLDVRVSSDVGGHAIQSRVQFVLRGPKEKLRPGWYGLWVSPDLVTLMKASAGAQQPEAAPAEESATHADNGPKGPSGTADSGFIGEPGAVG